MGHDIDRLVPEAIVLETRIPQGRQVQGLEYGAFATLGPSGDGYYVRIPGRDRVGWARMTPASDELLETDAEIVEAIAAEFGVEDYPQSGWEGGFADNH